ncbi:hypothetical protein ACFXPX_32590 [Kitasatospora sp. NPDC059146]|uniref:hypothetical protein n=1 Tax=unclassified Kitasatospora TaxID=2633591 RepID=UPI0035D5BD04
MKSKKSKAVSLLIGGAAMAIPLLGVNTVNAPQASAMTFDPNACLDLSQVQKCENGTLWGFVRPQGPTQDPCGMPWRAVKVGNC